jgi:hypothetical protein
MAMQAIQTTTQQLGRNQVVKAGHNNSDSQARRISKSTLKGGHPGSAMESIHRDTLR